MPPVSTLIALADPTRCRIIEILRDGPQPVHVLAAGFTISRPAISRHLRVLKQARLITEKKTGRENVYRLQANKLEPVRRWIAGILPNAAAVPLPIEAAPIIEAPVVVELSPAMADVSTVETPTPVELPQPAEVVSPVDRAPKSRKQAAISQMGFDF